jgi:hypothetical protein
METRATQLAKAYKLAKACAKSLEYDDASYAREWDGHHNDKETWINHYICRPY